MPKTTPRKTTPASGGRVDIPSNDLQHDADVDESGVANDPGYGGNARDDVLGSATDVIESVVLPTRRTLPQMTSAQADATRARTSTAAVLNAKSGQRHTDIDVKHLGALGLYESARNDLRDLKLAEHATVRMRDEAIAKCCERMVGKEANEADGRAPKRDGSSYMHSETSATAWAYANDPTVRRLQAERDQLTVSLFHAEAAVDIAERALKATALLLARHTSGTIAAVGDGLATSIDRLPEALRHALQDFGPSIARAIRSST